MIIVFSHKLIEYIIFLVWSYFRLENNEKYFIFNYILMFFELFLFGKIGVNSLVFNLAYLETTYKKKKSRFQILIKVYIKFTKWIDLTVLVLFNATDLAFDA